MDVDILTEAVKTANQETALARQLVQEGRWPVKPVAVAMGVSRPHLTSPAADRPLTSYAKGDDEALLRRIRAIVDARLSYGYWRVTARLNREWPAVPVNHERVYRVMKQAGLLLARCGRKPNLLHDGKAITMASDLRWCSDMFELRYIQTRFLRSWGHCLERFRRPSR